MRKVAAHYIYSGEGQPVKFGVVSLDGNTVVGVSPSTDSFVETAHTEFYPGVLIPAIINVTLEEKHIWYPKDDADIKQTLSDSTSVPPLVAAITPRTAEELSSAALMSLYQSGIALVLSSASSSHPAILFRLMVQLAEKLPDIPFTEIVKIATSNGAAAMGLPHQGTIATGHQSGIYHISGFDFAKRSISIRSKVEVIIEQTL